MSQTPAQPNQPNMQPYCVEDDEIDLGEVFRKIAQGKVFIIGSMLLTMLAVAAIGVLWLAKNPPSTEHSNIIRFNFPTAEQGKYPSGQRFTRNDIVASVVLAKVYQLNKLDQLGISMKDFGAAITATPYAPNAEFIKAKYQKLLSNKKLSQTEIAELEKKYTAELSAAQARFAQISYTSLAMLGLSDTQIQKILIDIPKVWSETVIQDLGVLDLKIPSGKFFRPEHVDAYEYIQGVQYLKDSAKIFEDSLKQLAQDEVGGQIRDPETGMVISDIQAQLNNLKNFIINPLVPLVATSGIARNLDEAFTYSENKIQQLKDQIQTLQEQASIYAQAIKQYRLQQTSNGTQNATSQGIIQYGSDFLSKITEPVEKQKDTQFHQQLMEKEIELRLQIAELKNQIKELQRALEKYKAIKNGQEPALIATVQASIEKKLHIAKTELMQLINSYQRIRDLRNQQIIGHTGALYEQVSPEILTTSDLSSRLKKLALIAVGLGVVMLFIAIMIVLIRSRKPNEAKQAA